MNDKTIAVPAHYLDAVKRVTEQQGCELVVLMTSLGKTYFKKLIEEGVQINANDFFNVISLMDKTGLSPFNSEFYPVISFTGVIKHVTSLDGWLAIGQRHKVSNISFTYSENLITVANEMGPLEVHAWIDATVIHENQTITMREFMAESFSPMSEAWRKPNSRLRYLALTQCYRVAFGIHDLGEEQQVLSESRMALTQSYEADQQLKAKSAVVGNAVVEVVEDDETVTSETATTPVDSETEIEVETEADVIVEAEEQIEIEVETDADTNEADAEEVVADEVEAIAETNSDEEPVEQADATAEIVIIEDMVDTRTLSIINQYIQGVATGLFELATLESFIQKKILNKHDRAWAESKVKELKARM